MKTEKELALKVIFGSTKFRPTKQLFLFLKGKFMNNYNNLMQLLKRHLIKCK